MLDEYPDGANSRGSSDVSASASFWRLIASSWRLIAWGNVAFRSARRDEPTESTEICTSWKIFVVSTVGQTEKLAAGSRDGDWTGLTPGVRTACWHSRRPTGKSPLLGVPAAIWLGSLQCAIRFAHGFPSRIDDSGPLETTLAELHHERLLHRGDTVVGVSCGSRSVAHGIDRIEAPAA